MFKKEFNGIYRLKIPLNAFFLSDSMSTLLPSGTICHAEELTSLFPDSWLVTIRVGEPGRYFKIGVETLNYYFDRIIFYNKIWNDVNDFSNSKKED